MSEKTIDRNELMQAFMYIHMMSRTFLEQGPQLRQLLDELRQSEMFSGVRASAYEETFDTLIATAEAITSVANEMQEGARKLNTEYALVDSKDADKKAQAALEKAREARRKAANAKCKGQ